MTPPTQNSAETLAAELYEWAKNETRGLEPWQWIASARVLLKDAADLISQQERTIERESRKFQAETLARSAQLIAIREAVDKSRVAFRSWKATAVYDALDAPYNVEADRILAERDSLRLEVERLAKQLDGALGESSRQFVDYLADQRLLTLADALAEAANDEHKHRGIASGDPLCLALQKWTSARAHPER